MLFGDVIFSNLINLFLDIHLIVPSSFFLFKINIFCIIFLLIQFFLFLKKKMIDHYLSYLQLTFVLLFVLISDYFIRYYITCKILKNIYEIDKITLSSFLSSLSVDMSLTINDELYYFYRDCCILLDYDNIFFFFIQN